MPLRQFFLAVFATAVSSVNVWSETLDHPPNIILIVADDLGMGDLGVYGNDIIKTPHLDALAAQGVVFNQFYASANICSPSRAGLLTGRYPIRSGMAWDVVNANDEHGLPTEEVTIAEMLNNAGYNTAMVGKWHLGNRTEFWPTHHGFKSFYGVLHSNDMPNFALYENDKGIEQPVDQSTLTRRYTERAVAFIEDNSKHPFFLYLAHTFPHIPLYASEAFAGRSQAGPYGDTVEEIDWSTGEVVKALKQAGVYDNTLIFFTSDNGAWWEGSNAGAKGAKGSTWDGAYRVGLIASWPQSVEAGQASDVLSVNVDLLPTIAQAAGTSIPANIEIDGVTLLPLVQKNNSSETEHRYFYYFDNEEIVGIRDQRWKLLRRAYYRHHLGALDKFIQLPGFVEPYWLLFDMENDPEERYSLADSHPEIVQRLKQEMEQAEEAFRETATREKVQTYPP
ncbi:MAG: sulfatase [Pseudomonadota bacterium]